jgi:hypothetical protein
VIKRAAYVEWQFVVVVRILHAVDESLWILPYGRVDEGGNVDGDAARSNVSYGVVSVA